jgi:hypothetical protein
MAPGWKCCTCDTINPGDRTTIDNTRIPPCFHCDHRCCYECEPGHEYKGREQVTVPSAMSWVPTPMAVKRMREMEKEKKEKRKESCIVL